MELADVRAIALGLPEATEAPHHDMTSFRVRGKICATAPPDEAHVHVFVDESRDGGRGRRVARRGAPSCGGARSSAASG